MLFTKPLLLGIFATALASAQIAVNGPIEGFLFDVPTGSLRAVMGLPGSATLGPSLADGIDFSSVAPRQSYAIVFQAGQCQLLTGLNAASLSSAMISGVARRPEGAAWSADGTVAILYSRGENWVQILRGFPDAPTAGNYQDISSLGGTLSAVASDPQGKQIAVAVSGTSGAVYLTTDSQSFVPVLQSPNAIALSFSADARSLYALDNVTPQVAVVDLNTFSSQSLTLDGLSNPLAVHSDQDAQGRPILYVASGSDQLLRIIDVASQQVVSDVSLNATPSAIDRLGLHSFVIASRSEGNQPLWLFTSLPVPASYFVPAVQAIAGGLQ